MIKTLKLLRNIKRLKYIFLKSEEIHESILTDILEGGNQHQIPFLGQAKAVIATLIEISGQQLIMGVFKGFISTGKNLQ